jgi:hypothetical protein
VFLKKSFDRCYFCAEPLGVLSNSLLSSVISTRRLAARAFLVLLFSTFLAGAQTKNEHAEQRDLMLLRQVTNDTLGTLLAQPEVMTVISCFVRETLDL